MDSLPGLDLAVELFALSSLIQGAYARDLAKLQRRKASALPSPGRGNLASEWFCHSEDASTVSACDSSDAGPPLKRPRRREDVVKQDCCHREAVARVPRPWMGEHGLAKGVAELPRRDVQRALLTAMHKLHEREEDDTADSALPASAAGHPWLLQEWPRPNNLKPFFERA